MIFVLCLKSFYTNPPHFKKITKQNFSHNEDVEENYAVLAQLSINENKSESNKTSQYRRIVNCNFKTVQYK